MPEKEDCCFLLTLIRHGETKENRDRILQGQKDTHLSGEGHVQARKTANYLRNTHIDILMSSDLYRTIETAEAICAANIRSLLSKEAIEQDPRLRERSFGVYEGRKLNEVRNLGALEGRWKADWCPEGGEKLEQLHSRANSFFNDLCKRMWLSSAVRDEVTTSYSPIAEKENGAGALTLNAPLPPPPPPNVTLSPSAFGRLGSNSSPSKRIQTSRSTSSISSGRNSYEEPVPTTSCPVSPQDASKERLSVSSVEVSPASSQQPCRYHGHVAVVSHGGLINELLRYFEQCGCQGGPMMSSLASGVVNCGISQFTVHLSPPLEASDPPIPRLTCFRFNDHSHLRNTLTCSPLVDPTSGLLNQHYDVRPKNNSAVESSSESGSIENGDSDEDRDGNAEAVASGSREALDDDAIFMES